MSDIVLGSRSVFKVARTSAATKTTLTGSLHGVDNLLHGRSFNTRNVPGGRGNAGVQDTIFVTHDFSHVADDNSVNGPIYGDANSKRLYCEYGPEGESTGSPKYEFEAVVTTTWTQSYPDFATVFNVSYMVDGSPTVGTY